MKVELQVLELNLLVLLLEGKQEDDLVECKLCLVPLHQLLDCRDDLLQGLVSLLPYW